MPRLIACPSCAVHVKSEDARCPHCGAPIRDAQGGVGRTASAVLMGLAIAGCPGDDGGTSSTVTAEPEYGVPATDSAETSSGDSTATGGQTSTSATTTTSGMTASTTMSQTTDAGEAEYGVPDTGWADSTSGTDTDTGGTTGDTDGSTSVEPDYGLPSTT